jgi:hypothetical protein
MSPFKSNPSEEVREAIRPFNNNYKECPAQDQMKFASTGPFFLKKF